MKAKKVDALTRDIVTKAGFGEYYVHSTGHGVGLDIHEMPYISAKSDTIIEDGMVYVNGDLLEEEYYDGYTAPDMETVVVPENQYFVMGDNRPVSLDSRNERVGFVDKESIVGKSLIRVWPLNKFGKVN